MKESPDPKKILSADASIEAQASMPEAMTRREIMRAALAAAIASATGIKPDSASAAPGDTRSLRDFSRKFKQFFKSRPRLIEEINRNELATLLRAMKSVGETQIQGTSYDFKGLPAGSMVLRSERGFGNGIVIRFNERNSEGVGLHKRYMVVTPKHVAIHVPAPFGKKWTEHPGGYDLCACEINEADSRATGALFLARKQEGEDLSGEIGVVLGTDTDGQKRFPAVISPRIGERNIFQREKLLRFDESNPKDVGDGRFIVLPDGEAAEIENTQTGRKELPVQGMSGSPVVYVPEGARGVQIAGIIVAAGELSQVMATPTSTYVERTSLGFFLDTPILWQLVHALPERR